MTTQTHYFDTRSLARANVEVLNGKLKDFGATAPKGERWAVLVEDVVQSDNPILDKLQNCNDNFIKAIDEVQQICETSQSERNKFQDNIEEMRQKLSVVITAQEAKTILNRPGSIIGDQVLSTPNNKPVRVSWRRNMTAVKLANHLAKVS